MDFIGEGVEILQTRAHCLDVPAESLVNSDVTLVDLLVGILHTASKDTGTDDSQISAAISKFVNEFLVSPTKLHIVF